MVKKSSLAKKLASYSAVAAAVLVADKNASAQVVYTNLSPYDTVGPRYNPSYQLDLNNDGVYDFVINFTQKSIITSNHGKGYETSIEISAYNSNQLLKDTVEWQGFAQPLKFGDTISINNHSWYNKGSLVKKDDINYFYGPWISYGLNHQSDNYAGFKIIKGGKTFYGWARISIGYAYAVIKDYAYNTVPDSIIYAGEKCEGFNSFPTIQANDSILTTSVNNKPIQWYLNSKPISGDTTQTISASQYGIYTVSEGDTNSICSLTSLVSFNYINCSSYRPDIIGTPIQYFCWNYAPGLNIDTVRRDFSVQWYSDNVLLAGDTSQYIITQYIFPERYFGNFYAVVYEQGGCYDTTNKIDLVVDTTLSSLVIKQSGDTLIAENRNGSLYSNSDIIYQWFDSVGMEIAGATNYYYVIPVSGEYTVTASDTNLCGTQYRGYYLTTGINQINPANIFIAESNNLLNIKFNEEPYNGYKLVIYNYIGQQVYTTEIISGNMTIDLNALAKGFYLVALEKENSRVVKKIVLQ